MAGDEQMIRKGFTKFDDFMDIRFTTEHLEYLRLQRGALHDLGQDSAAWGAAYRHDLIKDFTSMRMLLPRTCQQFLSVGSGLGGLEILLWRHYLGERGGTEAWLLDGKDDMSEVVQHNKTFNSEEVTRSFWKHNEAVIGGYIDAACYDQQPWPMFDFVVSTKSWCFHYEPRAYLDFVAEHTRRGAIMIIDLRTGKSDWTHQLEEFFKPMVVLRQDRKSNRFAWRRR